MSGNNNFNNKPFDLLLQAAKVLAAKSSDKDASPMPVTNNSNNDAVIDTGTTNTSSVLSTTDTTAISGTASRKRRRYVRGQYKKGKEAKEHAITDNGNNAMIDTGTTNTSPVLSTGTTAIDGKASQKSKLYVRGQYNKKSKEAKEPTITDSGNDAVIDTGTTNISPVLSTDTTAISGTAPRERKRYVRGQYNKKSQGAKEPAITDSEIEELVRDIRSKDSLLSDKRYRIADDQAEQVIVDSLKKIAAHSNNAGNPFKPYHAQAILKSPFSDMLSLQIAENLDLLLGTLHFSLQDIVDAFTSSRTKYNPAVIRHVYNHNEQLLLSIGGPAIAKTLYILKNKTHVNHNRVIMQRISDQELTLTGYEKMNLLNDMKINYSANSSRSAIALFDNIKKLVIILDEIEAELLHNNGTNGGKKHKGTRSYPTAGMLEQLSWSHSVETIHTDQLANTEQLVNTEQLLNTDQQQLPLNIDFMPRIEPIALSQNSTQQELPNAQPANTAQLIECLHEAPLAFSYQIHLGTNACNANVQEDNYPTSSASKRPKMD